MAEKKRRRSSENEKSKDVLSIVSNENETKKAKTREVKTRKRYCRSLRVQERDRRLEDGESVNAIKSEVLVDESMPIVERFDAVMKSMSNIVFGSTNRESNLIYFVNPTLLWSTNWSWIETELAESMVIVKYKTAQWMRIICSRDSAK